jgi:superoxide dismutase, Cu-Zn family
VGTSRPGRNAAIGAIATGLAVFAASPSLAGVDRAVADGRLVRYVDADAALAPLVPAGASARVEAVADAAGDTTITLRVHGLAPDHGYGAHVHRRPCGRLDPRTAGGHVQLVPNPRPRRFPHDPRYVNHHNEIWLDFDTDASGAGSARVVLPWQFWPGFPTGSVMIHAEHTSHGGPGGGAGTAGAAVACLTVRL